jgi:hypothetical protein
MRSTLLLFTLTLTCSAGFAQSLASQQSVTFTRDVMVVLTKEGCNSSSCHGGVKGKGGFKLSLDGLDPKEDYKWIVKGGTYQVLSPEVLPPIRARVDVKDPERSLLLLKGTMAIPHGGGERFKAGSSAYSTILQWVRGGTPYGEDIRRSLRGVEPSASEIVLVPGQSYPLHVNAQYSDGRRPDVTEQVQFESLNPEVARVTSSGVIEAHATGETAIILRWAGQYAYSRVGVSPQSGAARALVPRNNFIDDYVFGKLHRFRIQPSALSSDQEFLRRVCLDLAGTLPPPARVRQFVASKDPRKRERLIDTLVASPEYVDFWTLRFSDLFRVRGEYGWNLPFWEWVRQSVATNKPYDQMARETIAAQGYGGPAHKHMVGINKPPPVEQMMNETVRVFMGRRLDCAQCHNHPFDRWTQNQYWGLAAFFGNMTNTGWGYDNAIYDDPRGQEEDYVANDPAVKFIEVIHPRTKEVVKPAFMDGTVLPEGRRSDPRLELAKWITSHPYFAEATVNRMWSYFFGRGIVDPVDDFRVANPPTHPDLLAALARDFREHGYNLKHLIRVIVTSRTYQLTSKPNDSNGHDEINYSHALPRPLESAVLLDAISQVTGVPEVFGKMPVGTRAIQMRSPGGSPFFSVFERPLRDVVPEPTGKATLGEALHMLAGPTFNEKLSKQGGRLQQLSKSGATDREIVEEFYLAALARYPSEQELGGNLTIFHQRPREEVAQDLVWALLTSREFCENH